MTTRSRESEFSRRAFLGGVGVSATGLALGLFEGRVVRLAHGEPAPRELRPNPFVRITADGTVEITCHRSEMGQGVRSSLPVLLADELGADLARVRIVQADGHPKYGDQNTDGSSSVRGVFDDMRRVAATARVMLIAAAAARWRVPATRCQARDSAVQDLRTRRLLRFDELVAAASAMPVPDPKKVVLRPREELVHLGRATPLLDGDAMVRGGAIYGADVRLDGMLTAVIVRPPTVFGTVRTFDPVPALAVPGVRKVVKMPAPKGAAAFQPLGGVAVIADHTWAALKGRAALAITWEAGPNRGYDSEAYRDALLASVRRPGKVVRSVGDVKRGLAGAARVVSAEYYAPHLAHASMEPPAAVARITPAGCEVWAPTQDPQTARGEVAQALGLPPEKVTVHVTFIGGGFGRKSKPDFIVEAALLAREAGAPVRVQWTREDDIQHDYFHTVSAQRLDAGIDGGGKVVAWRHRTAFPPIGATFDPSRKGPSPGELGQGVTDLPLDVASVAVEACDAEAHVRIGWLRSVCNIFHGFAIGSFIDELAHARGADPRETWLELLGPARALTPKEAGIEKFSNYGAALADHPIDVGRHRKVIERVTEMAGWDRRKQAGRGLGLAAHRSFLTSVGVVAAVVQPAGGPLRVDEVWVVMDAGTILNLDRVRAQVEGAVLFGISLAFHGAITMKGGAVQQTNFRDYRIARIGEAPRKIHVEVIKSEAAPGGVGEPGVPPVAPAIANAVFALTGKRRRELPFLGTHARR